MTLGKVDTKNTVDFENYFNNDIWVMANLFRGDRAQFRARKIVAYQATVAEAGQNPRYLVHQRITSTDGQAFLASLDLKKEGVYALCNEKFDTFVNKISNGGFSKSMLRDINLEVADAKLLVEVFPNDIDDDASSEIHSFEHDEEPPTPSESGQSDVTYRYTVVMKTAPLKTPKDDAQGDCSEKQ